MTRIRLAQGVLILLAVLIAVFVLSGGLSFGDDDACAEYGINCGD